MNQPKHEARDQITTTSEEAKLNNIAKFALRQRAIERTLKNDEHPEQGLQVTRTEIHDRIISLLHDLAKEVMHPSDPPFYAEHEKTRSFVRCTPLGQQLVNAASADFYQIEAAYPLHDFSPVYKVFTRLRRAMSGFPSFYVNRAVLPKEADQTVVDALRLVDALRRALGRKSVKTANENFRRGAMDNFNGLSDSVSWLAQHRQEVIGLRFDLLQRSVDSQPVKFGDPASLDGLDEFMACRERFHRSLDRHFGKKLLGYFWALEYGRESKFHIHYFVIVSARVREDHVELVEMIGGKWASVTDGHGYIYNANEHANRQAYPALGHVNLNHPQTIKGLQFLMSYLTLAGLFVKLNVKKRFRTFAKGRFPKQELRKVGRPQNRARGSRLKISVAEARSSFMKFI